MNQRLWKCYLCNDVKGFDFMAEKPCCPKCGQDDTDPSSRCRGFIVPLVVLHYSPPAHEKLADKLSTGFLACQPTVPNGAEGTRVTGDPGVVNCPACKQTEEFKKWNRGSGVPGMYRVPEHTPQSEG